jgi:hypothetical protein
MLWVVLVAMVVTILRFTINPTIAVAALGRFYPVVVLYIHNSTVSCIVLVTASAVVPILGLTPHHSY